MAITAFAIRSHASDDPIALGTGFLRGYHSRRAQTEPLAALLIDVLDGGAEPSAPGAQHLAALGLAEPGADGAVSLTASGQRVARRLCGAEARAILDLRHLAPAYAQGWKIGRAVAGGAPVPAWATPLDGDRQMLAIVPEVE